MAENNKLIKGDELILETFFKKHNKTYSEGLTREEFANFYKEIYKTNDVFSDEIFEVFDENKDDLLDENELSTLVNKWLSTVIRPKSAFLIVDAQNDFISGSLALRDCPANQNGEEIVKPINNLLKTVKFDKVIYSLDWHPENHISFFENRFNRKLHEKSPVVIEDVRLFDKVIFDGNPPTEQVLWPKHCVQGTWGSELHKDLIITNGSIYIKKGINSEIDSYSAFWDNKKSSATDLTKILKESKITDVYVCGLAYDVCVGSTALDAISLGFRTILVEDCCRGVDVNGVEKIKKAISANGIIVHSSEVKNLINGNDRSPKLGHFLAKHILNSK